MCYVTLRLANLFILRGLLWKSQLTIRTLDNKASIMGYLYQFLAILTLTAYGLIHSFDSNAGIVP
jgi:hypothetical protein